MTRFRLNAFIALFLFFGTACSASSNDATNSLLDGVTILPVEDIVEGDLTVSNFANDGSATLPLQTSIPVACTLVYGTTPEFGMLTLDQDMAGGTHSDHSPLLTGLEPETDYYFRVQGVDDEGNIYLSDVMTFTTPPRDTSQTENLASPQRGAAVLGYSSAFNNAGPDDRWGANSAFDDNPNTEWSSAGDGDEAWIEVELAQRARIVTVSFQTRSMSDGSATAFSFTVTTDEGETHGPFELSDANSSYAFDVAIEAKTLRFDLESTSGGNTGAVDIAV